MTLKEIVKISSVFLGRQRVTDYLEKGGETDDLTLNTIDTLTRLANMVIRELNDGFLPMVKQEELEVKDGRLYFSSFSERVTEILSLTDKNGDTPLCKFKSEYIELSESQVIVEYKYLPSVYGLEDVVGYKDSEISEVVLAYGVTAEFCLTEKNFDESLMWHERYSEAINRIIKPKNATIKRRSFF